MTRIHPRFYCPTCGRLTAVTEGDRGWMFSRHQDPSIARRCPTTWAPKTGPGRPDSPVEVIRPQGTCPVCGKRTSLYRDGTLHDHGSVCSVSCAGARHLPQG